MGKASRRKKLRAEQPEMVPRKQWNWNIPIGTGLVCFLGLLMYDATQGGYEGPHLVQFVDWLSEIGASLSAWLSGDWGALQWTIAAELAAYFGWTLWQVWKEEGNERDKI